MTDPPNPEWQSWQDAWQTGPDAAAGKATSPELLDALRRRMVRHHRAAWAFAALDVSVKVALCGGGAYELHRSHALPVIAGAVSVLGFSAVWLGFAIWNRRDALVFWRPTADFLAVLRVRQDRRERTPRVLAWFAAAEVVLELGFFAIWAPGSLASAAAIYGGLAVAVTPGWLWYRKRLRRARAQLEALLHATGATDDADGAAPDA